MRTIKFKLWVSIIGQANTNSTLQLQIPVFTRQNASAVKRTQVIVPTGLSQFRTNTQPVAGFSTCKSLRQYLPVWRNETSLLLRESLCQDRDVRLWLTIAVLGVKANRACFTTEAYQACAAAAAAACFHIHTPLRGNSSVWRFTITSACFDHVKLENPFPTQERSN